MLKGERGDLAASLHNLGIAMRQVSGFVRDNREVLGKNITGLDRITQILVKQRAALAETLRNAPLALNNLALTYNPQAGTLDTRANLGEIGHQITSDPATFLCGILDQANQGGQACSPSSSSSARAGRARWPAPRRRRRQRRTRPDPTRRLGGLVEGRPMTRLRLRLRAVVALRRRGAGAGRLLVRRLQAAAAGRPRRRRATRSR